jgi:hypothetical protein
MEMSKWPGIPDGMVLIKKGGRPRSDARNVAILLTRLWRTELLHEPVKRADEWILNHWQGRNGITEESTIRRAIRAANEGPLKNYMFYRVSSSYDSSTGAMEFAGPVKVQCSDNEMTRGSTVWTWDEGMKAANSYTLGPPHVEFVVVDSFD